MKNKEYILSLIDALLNDITIGETMEKVAESIKEIKEEVDKTL